MDNHFNTPAEVIDLSIKACENKTWPVRLLLSAVLQAAQQHTQ